MGNIKEVNMRGSAPFDLTNDDEAARWLGILHAPLTNLHFKWDENDVRAWMSTKMYKFTIKGETSMMFQNLQNMVKAFENAGAVIPMIHVIDIEDVSTNQPDEWYRNEAWTK